MCKEKGKESNIENKNDRVHVHLEEIAQCSC
jgi:hypothetical protein